MVVLTKELREKIRRAKKERGLPPPPDLTIPELLNRTTSESISAIQAYISSFEYNYSGVPFVSLKRSRSTLYVFKTAQDIIRLGLPIQCVEATFLGCLLTAGMNGVDRVPLSFKSRCQGEIYRHIVLAIRFEDRWGAVGISRRGNLMFKGLNFSTLGDLVLDFSSCYAESFHDLLTCYVGMPFSHDKSSECPVKWRAMKVHILQNSSAAIKSTLSIYSSAMLGMFEHFKRTGSVLTPHDVTCCTEAVV